MMPFEIFGPSEILIVLLLVAYVSTLRQLRRARRERAVAHSSTADPEKEHLRSEVSRLFERLSVLERIAVEKEGSLEQEIERLRDKPVAAVTGREFRS